MESTITRVSDVDYALDLHVPPGEIGPRLDAALKKQRAGMSLKGFRPGKAPMALVRKMVGPQLAVQLAEEVIGEAFQDEVADNPAYDVLGQPRLAELEFDPTAPEPDLRAVVSFGVRPEIVLADTSALPVTKFVRTITDEEVEADVERRREAAAALTPAEDGAAVGEKDVATVDIQPVSPDGEPIGPVQTGAQIHLGDPGLREELRAGLLGKAVGDEFRLELPHQHGEEDGHDHEDHTDRYRVSVTGISHRALPDVDAAFVSKETGGRIEDVDAFRPWVRERMETSWERRAREAFENRLADAFLTAHPFPVPQTLVDATLDAMTDEVRQGEEGALPEGFDLTAFRDERRPMAEQQVRWYLLKDALIREAGIEVTEADFDAEFDTLAEGTMDGALVRSYFAQQPRLLEQMGDRLLNRRVFDALAGRFAVVEKGREELEREAAERAASGEPV